VARYDRVILPGGKGEVVLELSTGRLRGKVQKVAKVSTNDPDKTNVNLQLKALIKKSFNISPQDYVRFTIDRGEAWSKEFKVSSPRQKEFKIVKVSSPSRAISATHTLLPDKDSADAGNVYNLKVLISPEAPVGNVKGAIKIYTDIPGASPAMIHLRGRIEGSIHYQPEQLTFTPIINEGAISRTVNFHKAKGKGFKIKEVKAGCDDLKLKIIPVEEGRSYVLVASWTRDDIKKMHRGVIYVLTDSKEENQLDIPYTVFPGVEKRKF
jgi:hypothetical protein